MAPKPEQVVWVHDNPKWKNVQVKVWYDPTNPTKKWDGVIGNLTATFSMYMVQKDGPNAIPLPTALVESPTHNAILESQLKTVNDSEHPNYRFLVGLRKYDPDKDIPQALKNEQAAEEYEKLVKQLRDMGIAVNDGVAVPMGGGGENA